MHLLQVKKPKPNEQNIVPTNKIVLEKEKRKLQEEFDAFAENIKERKTDLKDEVFALESEKAKALEDLKNDLQASTKKRKELSDKETEQEKSLTEFKNKTENIKSVLLGEVTTLEKRKTEALEPVDKEREEARSLMERATSLLEKIEERESEIEKRIGNKEKELSLKEKDVKRIQTNLDKRNSKLVDKEIENERVTSFLKQERKTLNKDREEFKEFYEEQMKVLEDFKLILDSKWQDVEIQKGWTDEQKLKIKQDKLHIESQQQSLKSAFAEARKRNL